MTTVRPATPADVAVLARLRVEMYAAMGQYPAAGFAQACEAHFTRRLQQAEFTAVVVDGPDGVVAGGSAWVTEALVDANNLSALRVHVANICTFTEHRRQGHARLVMDALIAWSRARGIVKIELTATPAGLPLYESMGFVPSNGVSLRLLG